MSAPAKLSATARKMDGKMNTYEMEITPEQAKEFLKLNSTNRPLRPSWIKTLKGVIERGEWMVTHQGTAITIDNRLLDGQHRLHAIAATGITVRMQVSFDCDPKTYTVLDGGVKRSTQDHLGIPSMVGTVARLLWKLPNRTASTIPSSAQIASVLAWSQDIVEEVSEVATKKTKFSSAAIQLPLVVHLMAGHADVLGKFAAFRSLDFDGMPPSLKSLSKQIIEGKASSRNDSWDLSARAWRAFDPNNWQNPKIQVKDVDSSISEMNKVVELFRKRRTTLLRAVA